MIHNRSPELRQTRTRSSRSDRPEHSSLRFDTVIRLCTLQVKSMSDGHTHGRCSMFVVTGPSSSRAYSLDTGVHGALVPLALLGVLVLSLVAFADAHAQSHTALDFDGVDDYVETGDPLDFNGPFTVEAWIYARSGVDGGRFISTRTLSTGWEMDVSESGMEVDLRFIQGCCVTASASFLPYMNTWTHVAASWQGPGGDGEAKVYIDGVLAGTGSRTTDLTPSGTNLILGWDGAAQGNFDGRVDEVRVWSAVLDEITIQTWMHRHVTPSHPDFAALEASWQLDEGSGQVAASEVNSPTMDGRLGSTTGVDASDPSWVASDVVPTRKISVSELKSHFRQSR